MECAHRIMEGCKYSLPPRTNHQLPGVQSFGRGKGPVLVAIEDLETLVLAVTLAHTRTKNLMASTNRIQLIIKAVPKNSTFGTEMRSPFFDTLRDKVLFWIGRWVTHISVSFFNNGLGNNLETRTKFRIAVREECDLQRGHWISDSQRELAIYRHLRRFVPEIETLVSMNETEKALLTMVRLLDQLRCLDKAVEEREPVRSLLLYARLRIGALESPQYFNAAPKEVWIVMIRHLFDAAWICFSAIALG